MAENHRIEHEAYVTTDRETGEQVRVVPLRHGGWRIETVGVGEFLRPEIEKAKLEKRYPEGSLF